MHFFKNSISFLAVMCVCGAAYSAARVGVTTAAATASRRLPSLSNVAKAAAAGRITTTTNSTSSSSSVLVSDADCIEDYRSCMKGDNACGPNFEECTTNVLFHGHMGECFSTLYQCSSTALQSLFGTSNLNALSEPELIDTDTKVTNKNNQTLSEGEVLRYKYPFDSSIMGIDIIGAATRNKLSTADCVKKYKKCLNKDSICGEDFELCTSASEFQKQAPMCDSTLSRCQKEGFQQLFGDDVTTKPSLKKLSTITDGVIKQWIDDGAALAAGNAVNTCYKVTDSCFLNACAKNPYNCVENVNWGVVNSAEAIGSNEGLAVNNPATKEGTSAATDVRKFFRAACTDTIGANQYCFMTFHNGDKPTKADLQDEDLREEVFDEAYAARKSVLSTKVTELVKKFDSTARDKCIDTFKSCAIRSCGGGSGAACYSRVFGNGSNGSINAGLAYNDIKTGCSASVNMDANCGFLAAMQNAENPVYTFDMDGNNDSFNVLFPAALSTSSGVVSGQDGIIVRALNQELQSAYNPAAIEGMKKQCQTLVENCVTSMCGKDYQNCYRNRNDVMAGVYSSGNSKFDNSMNKVGGVLDYTIVQGLCSSTIRNADACAETLAIAKMGISDGEADTTAGWGNSSNLTTLNNAWRQSASMATGDGLVNDVNANGKRICECTDENNKPTGTTDVCGDESGGNMNCMTPHRVSKSSLMESQAVATLFQDILALVESQAQAQYNAKLTREQNICRAQNSGANPNPAFVWATFKSGTKVGGMFKGSMPSNYATNGLGTSTTDSNDIYGSFCRVRVTLSSEDHDVQQLLSGGKVTVNGQEVGLLGIDGLVKDKKTEIEGDNSATAYFATGDAFTCGSWLSDKNMDALSKMVAAKARRDAGEGSQKDFNTRLWTTLGVGTLGGAGSYIGMNALQKNGSSLGGLLKSTSSADGFKADAKQVAAANKCVEDIETLRTKVNDLTDPTDTRTASQIKTDCNEIVTKMRAVGISITSSACKTIKNNEESEYVWANESDNQAIIDELEDRYVKDSNRDLIISWLDDDEPDVTKYDKVKKAVNRLELKPGKTESALVGVIKPGLYQKNNKTGFADEDWKDKYLTGLDKMEQDCQRVIDNKETEGDRKTRVTNNILAGVGGAVLTGALANGITSTVQKAKYETAGNEAVKEWMDSIGSKIHCYVGGELVGDFGDIISIDISED